MGEFLARSYPVILALHVIAMVAWMAGIFYLPRLFVYHAEAGPAGSDIDRLLATMERRLLRAIMTPAMIATWIFGLALLMTPGLVDWGQVWPWTKAAAVLAMSGFHGWCAARRRDFARGANTRTGRQYRIANELPTILLIVIVASVIVKF